MRDVVRDDVFRDIANAAMPFKGAGRIQDGRAAILVDCDPQEYRREFGEDA